MTNIEQRIAIAEACGWKLKPIKGISVWDAACYGGLPDVWYSPKSKISKELPDYPNDLDAMHEAVLHLRKNGDQFQWLQYQKELFKVVWNREANGDDCILSSLSWDVIEATAAQRAEAFLRTIGKWKEEETK